MKPPEQILENLAPTLKDSFRKSIPAHLKNAERRSGHERFVALLDSIRLSLHAGSSRIVVYETHHALLGMSYSQFARYVARYINSTSESPDAPTIRPTPTKAPAEASLAVSKPTTVAIGQPRFHYDPTIPKERLI